MRFPNPPSEGSVVAEYGDSRLISNFGLIRSEGAPMYYIEQMTPEDAVVPYPRVIATAESQEHSLVTWHAHITRAGRLEP